MFIMRPCCGHHLNISPEHADLISVPRSPPCETCGFNDSPSACSSFSLVSWWSLLVTPPPSTVSELLLNLVLGSLLGLGGGCLRLLLESSSPPPTEWRDCDLTVKPWLAGGNRSCGAGIVMKPILKCFPEYAPSEAAATSSPILVAPKGDHVSVTVR